MKTNNILMWWLAYSVFFSATFVQLHHIEHIVEDSVFTQSNINSNSISSTLLTPLESLIDQCDICTQCSSIDHSIVITHSLNIFDHVKIKHIDLNGFNEFYTSQKWSSSQPRAPPVFYIT